MAWSWMPVPRRYLEDDRVLRLPVLTRLLFREILCGSDEHGRFDAGEVALRRLTGIFDGDSLQRLVVDLAKLELVFLYWIGPALFGVIDHFDADAPKDVIRKRPAPTKPSPPPCIWERAKCDGGYTIGKAKDVTHDKPRDDAVAHDVHAVLVASWERAHGVPTASARAAHGVRTPENVNDNDECGASARRPHAVRTASGYRYDLPADPPTDAQTPRAREVAPLPGPAEPEPDPAEITIARDGINSAPMAAQDSIYDLLVALVDFRFKLAARKGGLPPCIPGSPAFHARWAIPWQEVGPQLIDLAKEDVEGFVLGAKRMIERQKGFTNHGRGFVSFLAANIRQAIEEDGRSPHVANPGMFNSERIG
jgi:hypothetical protein